MFGGKFDVGAPEDDFGGGGHALSSFGPASDGQLVLEANVNRFL